MKADAIKNMAVVSIADGAKLGYVDDLVFDARDLRIAAVRVSAEGQKALIPFDQIQNIGSDAITVPGPERRQLPGAAGSVPDQPNLDAIGKLKVVNEAGTLLGTIKDLEVDPKSGAVMQLGVHKGGVLGIGGSSYTVAPKDVISVGEELIVVRAEHVTE